MSDSKIRSAIRAFLISPDPDSADRLVWDMVRNYPTLLPFLEKLEKLQPTIEKIEIAKALISKHHGIAEDECKALNRQLSISGWFIVNNKESDDLRPRGGSLPGLIDDSLPGLIDVVYSMRTEIYPVVVVAKAVWVKEDHPEIVLYTFDYITGRSTTKTIPGGQHA